MADNPGAQFLTVDDFSGGITDYYIAGRPNQFQKADNFVINDNRKLELRPGSTNYDTTYYQIPAGQQRLVSLFESESQLFQHSARNVYYINSGWNTLQGPGTNPVFSAGTTAGFASYAKWNKHVICANDEFSDIMRIYKDGSTWKVNNVGLPALATDPTITPGANTSKSFIYAFVRKVTYTSGGVTFIERSAPRLVSVSNADAPQTNANAITLIPTLSNGGTGNYDTANIKVEIYRTVHAGTTLYYVGEVTNGTANYNDNTADATIQLNDTIYTDSGVLDYEQPPPAKYVIQANDCVFYLHTKEDSVTYPNRFRQANPSQPFAAPHFDEVDDEITGGGVIGIYPIIFCKSKIYRLEGFFDEFGRGSIDKREISRTVGCVSHRSIVQIREGIVFAGDDGFYFTNGFDVMKISDEFNATYKDLVDTDTKKSRISGCYDPVKNRVYWAVQADSSSNDCDKIFVAHFRWGIKRDTPFTTWSGGEDFVDNFAPSFVFMFNKVLLRADRRGYLFKHPDSQLDDKTVDTATAPTNWIDKTIIYDYRSCAFDFGSPGVRKWVPQIMVSASNVSNISLGISGSTDNTGVFRDLKEIRYLGNLIWGDPVLVWGDETLYWNFTPDIEHKRWFPAQNIRCTYKQVKFTNSYTIIDRSDDSITADVDGTANTVTLNAGVYVWISDAIDYFISFENDNYTNQYQITGRTNTVLTVQDSGNNLTTMTDQKWQIAGYRKSEFLSLLSYTLKFVPLTTSQRPYDGTDGGND